VSTPQDPTQWVLTIRAEGEVRDADGNLLNSPVAESSYVVSGEEAQRLLEGQDNQ